MAIDPANLPIFGDPKPVDPPAPVRAASAVVIAATGVNAVQAIYFSSVSGYDLTVFLIPLTLTVWFALSVRAGRSWARSSSLMTGCVTLFPGVALFEGPGEFGTVLVAMVLLVLGARLMYRADVREYFEPLDCPEQERV